MDEHATHAHLVEDVRVQFGDIGLLVDLVKVRERNGAVVSAASRSIGDGASVDVQRPAKGGYLRRYEGGRSDACGGAA
jgi:hypothetical protein